LILKYAKQLPNNPRIKVIDAVQTSVDRYFAGETYTSIMLPPRYGKSSVFRLIALELNASTKMPLVMAAPWVDNVTQILEKEKGEQTFRDYGVVPSTQFKTHRVVGPLRTFNWWRLDDGTVPTLLTCTLDLITNAASRAAFCDGLNDMRQRFGCRPIIGIDESQLVKELRERGRFVVGELVAECDAFVILATGTPVAGIPGFEDEWEEWKETIRKIPRRKVVDGKIEYVLQTWEGQTHALADISADVEATWQEAWQIKALAGVNSVWINFDVFDDTGNPLGPLDQIPENNLSGRLKQIMEAPELMRKQVERALERLIEKRARPGGRQTQILVPTGQDDWINDRAEDKHARMFKEMFQEECVKRQLRLRIEIATGNVPAASSLVKEFRNGQIDILIVKGMALVGLDAPSCKILVWGTRLRQGPLALQALSRVLTTWAGMRADIIMPKDIKMVRFYDRTVKSAGGEENQSDLQLTKEEPYQPDQRQEWQFQDPRVDAYSDETGRTLGGDFELILQAIKHKYEIDGLSDLQIIENYNRGGFPLTEDDKQLSKKAQEQKEYEAETSGVQNLDEDFDKVYGQFGSEAKKIVSKYVLYDRNDANIKRKFAEAVARLQNSAKQLCNISSSIKVNDLNDVALLKRLIAALPHAERLTFNASI
jgi:hypothetical protein